jgi:hypothetical protein
MTHEAQPVLERIVLEIVRRLERITAANGFDLAASEVRRPTVRGMIAGGKDQSIDVIVGDADPVDDAPVGVEQYSQSIQIDLVLRQSDSDPSPIDPRANLFDACARWALLHDDAGNLDLTLGGLLCGRLDLAPPQKMAAADGSYEGKTILASAPYRTALGDAWTQR